MQSREMRESEVTLLREDYLGYERAAEKFVTIYLSALAAAVAFLLGPERLSIQEIVSGNDGRNIYLLMILCVINLAFMCFVLFKGLQIHEVMQFAVSRSRPGDLLPEWERWRRDRKRSLTKPIRIQHYIITSGFPVVVSTGLIILVAIAVFWAPAALVSEQAEPVVRAAWPGWVFVVAAHLAYLPRYIYLGSAAATKKWNEIDAPSTDDAVLPQAATHSDVVDATHVEPEALPPAPAEGMDAAGSKQSATSGEPLLAKPSPTVPRKRGRERRQAPGKPGADNV
jgi:hypothetical protein